MKSFSLVFLVVLYFVCTHINCDINSVSFNKTTSDLFFKQISFLISDSKVILPLALSDLKEKPVKKFKLDISLSDQMSASKTCLQNMEDCINKDIIYTETTNQLQKNLFYPLPPFDLSQVRGVSTRCKMESKTYLEELSQFKFWALQMYDATAKVPSGLLNGNVNQFGDFDVCLSANSMEKKIYAQYCLPSIQIEEPASPYLSAIHKLLHSHSHFKTKLNDPGHRVPKYSSINWALCIPSSCTSTDVELGIRHHLNNYFKNTSLKYDVRLTPSMCQSAKPENLPISTVVVTALFILFVIFIVMSTLYDYVAIENANQYVVAFSLKKNVESFLRVKANDDIQAVHGIRFVNSLLLVLAHKSMAVFFVPYSNRTQMVEFVSRPWTVIARAASLYTDPFLMMSGCLTAYSLIGKLQKNQSINIKEEYLNRLFRILPSFAVIIAFCTFVLPWTNQGPLWNQVITEHSDICKQNWWRNLLFIHNYFGFKNMCLTHTHHLGIDTQLFFASPFLILFLWKWPRKSFVVITLIAISSTCLRYYVTYTQHLSNYIHFGTSIKQLFNTADNMYILPAHRATVYTMGIFLGYFLRMYKNLSFSKTQIRVGNSISLFTFLIALIGPAFMGSINYVYNPVDAAWYAAFAPIFWCISFGWVVLSVHAGHKDLLGRFFSWYGFSIWTKISYSLYLTQFPIFFYNVGTIKAPEHYSFFRTNINVHEILVIILCSTILTLLVEMPFQNIRNVLLKKNKGTVKVKIEEEKTL